MISGSVAPLGRLMSSMIWEPLLSLRGFVVLATAGLMAFLLSAVADVSGLRCLAAFFPVGAPFFELAPFFVAAFSVPLWAGCGASAAFPVG